MYLVFYSTSDVFKSEEILQNNRIDCKVVATPVLDKAYCGVCVETESYEALGLVDGIEFEVVR